MATQAAVLAGFTTTCLVELYVPKSNTHWMAVYCLHAAAIVSICSNITCVSLATITSIWGSGKALRGVDGSMDEAVDAMIAERPLIFNAFAVGLASNLLTVLATCWIMMDFPFVLVPLGIVIYTCWIIGSNSLRIQKKFHLGSAVRLDDLTKFPQAAYSRSYESVEKLDRDDASLLPGDLKGSPEKARYRKSQGDMLV
jgi:hypothetical protein